MDNSIKFHNLSGSEKILKTVMFWPSNKLNHMCFLGHSIYKTAIIEPKTVWMWQCVSMCVSGRLMSGHQLNSAVILSVCHWTE